MKFKAYCKGFLVILGLALIAAALVAGGSQSKFKSTDKAFYLDERTASFVRPGLVMKVTKAEIAADGTIRAWIKLADPQGLALDRLGIDTPGAVTLMLPRGLHPGQRYTVCVLYHPPADLRRQHRHASHRGKHRNLAESS